MSGAHGPGPRPCWTRDLDYLLGLRSHRASQGSGPDWILSWKRWLMLSAQRSRTHTMEPAAEKVGREECRHRRSTRR